MAEKKVLVNLNFNGNQIINVRAEVAASAPSTNLSAGRFYFNSSEQKLYVYTTQGWKGVGDDNPSNMVTGNSLNANEVVVGNGGSTVKSSGFTIGKTVPSNAVFTDENVKQEATTNLGYELPLLFSKAEWNNGLARTGGAYFSQFLKYNPNTDTLTVKNLAATAGITINGNAVATEAYVNAQDQKINDRISNISGFGRYLSGWDMATGEPASLPTTSSYTLRTGDYFIINNVPSSGTKYKPNQTGTWQTDQQFARTTTTETCVVGGYWKYDGSSWSYFAPESAVTLPAFTNSTLGGIKGHEVNGYVYHVTNETEGYGMVYGWATKADNSNSHTITLSGDVTGSDTHNNTNNSNASISVTIANDAVTTAKIANGAVTGAKIANRAVGQDQLKAYQLGLAIVTAADHAQNPDSGFPYWESTGNANEYKVYISGVTRNGMVRLCETAAGSTSFGGSKEVDCVYEYEEDETGVYGCTIYINSATAPAGWAYYALCRYEAE